MLDINFLKDGNLTISAKTTIFDISFFKDSNYYMNLESYIKYVKACEHLVRTNRRYTEYKANLYAMGLNHCQVLGNIANVDVVGGEEVTIEMHHGPILTLFDYCAIIIDYNLAHKIPIDTFTVANSVLDEHFAGNVQTVMLSKTVHELVDSGKLFINFNQATGNINEFLHKYHDGLSADQIEKINKYISLSEKYDTFDNGLLDLKNSISNWDYNEAISREVAKNN